MKKQAIIDFKNSKIIFFDPHFNVNDYPIWMLFMKHISIL